MTALAPHLSTFLRERLPETRGASIHTCDSYAYAFKLLLEFAAKRLRKTPSAIELEALDATLVLAFLTHLEQKRGCSASTRNARLAAIRSFMRYAELGVPSILEQSRRVLAIPMKRTDTKLVRHLSQQEMEAILRAPDVKQRDGIRDRAMLHLAFAAGLRATELVTLPLAQVSMTGVPSVRIVGKGRKERVLSDNYTSPPTTITSPHPGRRDSSAWRRPSTGWRGGAVAAGERRAGEEADGRAVEARAHRRRGHEGRDGPKDRAEVRGGGEAALGDGHRARLAHA